VNRRIVHPVPIQAQILSRATPEKTIVQSLMMRMMINA